MNRKLNPLTENHLFTKAFRNGASDVTKLTAVYVMKNIKREKDGSLPATKLGIAVNAKLGGAVKRSRVKRIIREGYRELLPRISPGLILVISPRAAAFSPKVKSGAVRQSLDISFGKLGIYKGMTLETKGIRENKKYTFNKQNPQKHSGKQK